MLPSGALERQRKAAGIDRACPAISTGYSLTYANGQVNEHNAWVPRGHWLEDWEKQASIDFYQSHPDDGYRRVTDLMMDADIIAVSPSLVYRVLSQAGALRRWEAKPSKKGKGFMPRFGWLTDHRSQPTRIAHRRVHSELFRHLLLSVQHS